jgi:hypothetical protein
MTTHITSTPVLAQVAPFTWEDPDESLLEDRRGALPAFPSDVFSPGLSKWLERASRGAGCLIDHVAVPLLGVTSSLMGKARCVKAASSWIEPLTMWTGVVGESGSRKTPGLDVIKRAIDQIEIENRPIYLDAHGKHALRVEKAKAEMKQWRKECEDAVAKKTELPLAPIASIDIGEFIWPSLSVSDCTVPRLARLCMVRPRGMLQIRDEMAALFTGMRAAGSKSFYLESWNGGRFVLERVDADACFIVENLLVGLTGGFQPDKIARAFAGDEDGMYGRFLFGWPAMPTYLPLIDDIQQVDQDFKNLLAKLIWLPAEDENMAGKFKPRIIPLSDGARAEFELYRQFVAQTRGSVEGREQQWLSKSETHLLRLAGTLAFLAWADASSGTGVKGILDAMEPTEIKEKFMVAAVKLIREYFWPHARAVLRQIGLTDRHRNIRRVLRWVLANVTKNAKDQYEVSLMDIRREALSGCVDVEQARDLVNRMVTAGWLRVKPIEQTGSAGGRPRERWLVNPLLFKPAETAESAESDLSAVPAVPATTKTPKRRQA